jgi:outer membrane protein OmpA-like peptidoglycan-associated protein
MNPMNALKYSKLDVSLKDFALNPISPYAGKFIGFKIDQGTLQTKLQYQVAHDVVQGDNIIIIDQLALGEKVDSPDALDLPLKLGVTLLKDSQGRIKVQVPVEGNVKDPQFDFGKAIQSALTRTIIDASNAPFATISEVDGFTGEDLSTVAFEFGFSELQDREIQKLKALATLLKEKDALTLGIVGTANRRMDGAAIMGESPQEISAEEVGMAEDEMPVEDPAAAQEVDYRLKELAQQRAEAVRAYMIEQAAIDAARIAIRPIQITSETDDKKGIVRFALSIE